MSRVCLVLGFILIMALYSDAMPHSLNSIQCCFKYFKGRIPPEKIKMVEKISSKCAAHGFIVTMDNKVVCVRKNPWKK
ncbi:C-C motif chemokine 17-like [Neoarius graeffei]|uniref:C-C motif chemokine 17-like n=1 Tax=Neoarius graeffei TaxID=443677 RepID=UPI00298CC3D4|nr:C-C motif chemokine 17-like [Neoarius graeffei]